MIIDIDELLPLLERECLNDRRVASIKIPGTKFNALAVEADNYNSFDTWLALRNNVNHTCRWPVLYSFRKSIANKWTRSLFKSNPFNRRSYENEYEFKVDCSPESIINRAKKYSIEQYIDNNPKMYSNYLLEMAKYDSDKIRRNTGNYSIEEKIKTLLQSGEISNYFSLERWFLELEKINPKFIIDNYDQYFNWYEPKGYNWAVLLLPAENSWESLAYLHWYGAESIGTELVISTIKKWNIKYGAELVANHGTVLHFTVSRKPKGIDEAFILAMEQIALSPNTIFNSGVSLRNHARNLQKVNKWFLYERP